MIAILIGSGTANLCAIEVSKKVLSSFPCLNSPPLLYLRLQKNEMLKIRLIMPFLFALSWSWAQKPTTDEVLNITESELKREMTEFSKANQPPYFISYRIVDSQTSSLSSSFGSLTDVSLNHFRRLNSDVKIGSYEFDDSHPSDDLEGLSRSFREPEFRSSILLPLDNRAEGLKLALWQHTQNAYHAALSIYKDKKNAKKLADKPVPDFSKEKPEEYVDAPLPEFESFFIAENWKERLKKHSAFFLTEPDIVEGNASIRAGMERKYFVSSEGTRIAQNRTYVYLTINASIRTDDGDIVPLHQSYFAFDPNQIPSEETVSKDVTSMIVKLQKLKKAPLAEPYTGPAILASHAAGVFFHEIFGHRVEGHRLKNKEDGQTFKGKIGEEVLPKTLSVIFDPQVSIYQGQDLNGYYLYDDEGVKGQRITAVDHGSLKSFVMSRTPIENFLTSNGHGRAQSGSDPVSRQSNLIIENEKIVPMIELRKMLLDECKKQKKEYGYIFMDVVGGYTTTNRLMPNAFNIFPTEVYRIYLDGRPDELVRGVDLIGTPLSMFAEIQAADDKAEVFTGFCGAESGSVPVTAISPSLFVRQIETQRKPVKRLEKTLLPRPTTN